MLSNRATPIYYAEFRDQVLRGEIPVCEEISMEMNRIDALIEADWAYYDDEAVDGFILFCENECTLTDGEPLFLLPSFKLWAEQLYGWYYYDDRTVWDPNERAFVLKRTKHRLTKKQYLIVARGAAKSMYGSVNQNFVLNVRTATTHQITTAPTMKQAEEVLSPIRTAITRARGPLFKFLTEGSLQNTTGSRANRLKLASTKKGIENFLTGSLLEIRPMSIDKLQGLRPFLSTVDEWLSGDIREDVIGAIEQGASKQQDYLIIAFSSEGTVRNAAGDGIKMELMKILRGEYFSPHTSIFYYKLDNIEEVEKPEMWLKANPNIGKTVPYEAYHQDVERAVQNPSARNDILAKRFGLPLEGYTYFFTYEETIQHPPKSFWQLPCSLGVDLSQGDDFCAFTFMFPLGGERFGVKTLSYITERTLHRLSSNRRALYEEFIAEDSLRVMPGSILDVSGAVQEDLDEFIDKMEYDVRCVGYDPYGADEFIKNYIEMNGPFGVQKVIQGARTESVPLGELKKLATDRKLIFDQKLMKFAMGNAIVVEDNNENRKLSKKRNSEKIDPVSGLLDAFVAYKLNKDSFD